MTDFTTTLQKKFWYQSSLSLALARHLYDAENRPWWNLIDHNFYLGALPLSYMQHPQILKDLGITLVVTLLENFEISVLTPQWSELGIKNVIIKAIDFQPLDQDTFELIVQTTHEALKAGEVVYIHCKAGVGRSALGCMAYLLVHGLHDGTKFNSVQEVHDYVIAKRPLVNLSSQQKLCLHNFEENYKTKISQSMIQKNSSDELVNLSQLNLSKPVSETGSLVSETGSLVSETGSLVSEDPINLSKLRLDNTTPQIKDIASEEPLVII